ncbi:MAG: extracellular solute-binding protein [Deltaproteobacteria bacterium]|nr:extracellular solute-binding protein [Deltaproteobacteria bacterium]
MRKAAAMVSGMVLGFIGLILVDRHLSCAQSLPESVVENARKEGALNLYGSIRDDEAKGIFDVFKKRYPGIAINYFRSSEDKLVSKILGESKAGTYNFDIMDSSGSYHLKTLGLALKWLSPSAAGINPDLLDPDEMATPVRINTNVIQYNTKLVSKIEIPGSYEELADPKWRGKLCLEDSDFEWFAGMIKIMGKDKALDLFRRIAANKPTIRNGHGLLADLVAAGECPLAINQYGNQVALVQKRGGPTDFIAINPVMTIVVPAVISKNAPHANAAKLYVNWITSKEGQELIVKNGGRIPVRIDVDPDPPKLTKGLKLKIAQRLQGREFRDIQALYRQVWQGR